MKQLDFREGSITKSIVAGAVPMLIAQLVNLLYNLIDRVYIGRIPDVGSEALGGLGLTFPVIIMITAFTNLYAGGGAPLFSIAMGGKKKVRAEAIMQQCLYLEAATAVVLMIIGISCAEPLLKLFGAGETAMLYSLPYLRIYLLGTVFSMISIGMNPFINAQGFPMLGMISVVTGAVLNLGLDPLFIFAFEMGISGAALATIISQAVSAVIVFSILINKKMPLPLKLSFFSIKHPRVRLSLQIVTLGVASFVMQFTNALVNIVCNAVLSRTGGHLYISVMTVIASLRQVFETPILAICEGAAPFVSFNFGADRIDRVKSGIRVMSVMSLVYTAVVWVLIMVFPAMFISIFSEDPEIMMDAVRATRIYFVAFLFMTLQYIGQTSYKALNRRGRSIFFSIFRKVILVVPLTYLLPMIMEPAVNGVFAAEPVSNVIGGSASFVTMWYYVSHIAKNKGFAE
ncbi:MAG: MATE family efflux transporter [Eubacterium sp.]|nr:MATE family efflux transporter [Eubacterium sp.]